MREFSRFRGVFTNFLLAGITAGSLLAGTSVYPVEAAAIRDINLCSNYAKDAIVALADKNIISGDQQGNFNPRGSITRAEMVKVLVNTLGIDISNPPVKPTFPDVPKTHWAYKYVEAAYKKGIINGLPDGSFGIGSKLSRQEMAVMFTRSFGLSDETVKQHQLLEKVEALNDESQVSGWAKNSVDFVLGTGLMNGTGENVFTPGGSAERQQVAVVANRLLEDRDNIEKVSDYILAMNDDNVRIFVNGDTVNAAVKPEIINNEVYIPAEAFKAAGVDVSVDRQTGVIILQKNGKDRKNIILKTGSTDAYINYFGSSNPFDEGTGLESYRVSLDVSVKAVNGSALVPAVLAAETLGLQAGFNKDNRTLNIKNTDMTQYPGLNSAIDSSVGYKGEFNMNYDVNMKEKISGQSLSEGLYMIGAVNGDNVQARVKVTSDTPEYFYSEFKYDYVRIGETYYLKLSGSSPWKVYTREAVQQAGLLDEQIDQVKQSGQVLFNQYKNLNITRKGIVIIDGAIATKYTASVSPDIAQQVIYDQLGTEGSYTNISELFNKGFRFTVDFYVNGENQMVKEFYSLKGATVQNGSSSAQPVDAETSISINVGFKNTGADININAPSVE